jgi:hypothetical protein
MMRVSNTALADYCFETEHAMGKLGLAKATDFTLDMARDLIDARAENARLQARITELEGRSGYCVECERLARKVEGLEGQLAGAREDAELLNYVLEVEREQGIVGLLPLTTSWSVKDGISYTTPMINKLRAAIAARKKESNASTS